MYQLRQDIRSPNFDPNPITVEFVVVHYSACSLKRMLELFNDVNRQVSSHLLIDLDGTVYELVPCLNGTTLKAWHSGKSVWEDSNQKKWDTFNAFSIGIEMVNENGNIFPYTDAQYKSLSEVINHLKSIYPPLRSPERIIGHEQIAGFRGKSDPGLCFNWARMFSMTHPTSAHPNYTARLPATATEALKTIANHAPSDPDLRDQFFSLLSQAIEKMSISN